MAPVKRYLFQFLNAIEHYNDDFDVEINEENVKLTVTIELHNELGKDYSNSLEVDQQLLEDIIEQDYPFISDRYYSKIQ